MERHADRLKILKSQNLSEIRAKSATPEIFDEWFKTVGAIFDKYGLHDKPTYINNADETGFQPDPGSVKIITKKTTRNPYKLSANNPKTTYTMLVCCNANGEYLPVNFFL
jgi:hypothetical protein